MRQFQPEGNDSGPRVTEPDLFPEPYPWCLACGFQHTDDEHCPDCTRHHPAGHCPTPELARELATVDLDALRRQVDRQSGPLHAAAVEFLRAEDGA
jgi:hypothetical protein